MPETAARAEPLNFPDHTHRWEERSQEALDAEYRETGAMIGRWHCPGCFEETMVEPDSVRAGKHEQGEYHQYRTKCEVCGQPGTLHLTLEPEREPYPALVDELRAEFDQGHFIPWEAVIARLRDAAQQEVPE